MVVRLLLFLGVTLLPVYVFRSGGMQPAHAILTLFFTVCLLKHGLERSTAITMLGILAAYSFLIEAGHTLAGRAPVHLVHSAFLLFNYLLATATYGYVRRNGVGVFYPGFAAAVVITLATVLLEGVALQITDEGGRSTGAFNNPNQLGYFSVCVLSFAYILHHERRISFVTAIAFFAASLSLAIFSLSKAAMLANFSVILLALKPRQMNGRTILAVSLLLAVAIGLLLPRLGLDLLDYRFVDRLLRMSQEADSSLAERGYFAFLEGTALQILFGLGSADVFAIVGHEVHSSFGSILNSYGVLGLLLFLGLCLSWARQVLRAYGIVGVVCILGPPILYGITHNGTRFTAFWLLFAASLGMAQRLSAQARRDAGLPSSALRPAAGHG